MPTTPKGPKGEKRPAEAPPEDLLQPFTADVMEAYPVSTWVNKPADNDARCIEPAPQ
jgi:putative SOS response-associated peptidase YedK